MWKRKEGKSSVNFFKLHDMYLSYWRAKRVLTGDEWKFLYCSACSYLACMCVGIFYVDLCISVVRSCTPGNTRES